jgi:hypothetical protein
MCEKARATPPKGVTPPPPPGAIPVVKCRLAQPQRRIRCPPPRDRHPRPSPQILQLSPYGESAYDKYIYRWTGVHLSLKLPKEAQLTCLHTSTHTHRTVGPSAQLRAPSSSRNCRKTINSKIQPEEKHSTQVLT